MSSEPGAGRSSDLDERLSRIENVFRTSEQHLFRQGVIVSKVVHGQRRWVLRFTVSVDGRKTQRCDPSMCSGDRRAQLNHARRLLQRCRERAGWGRQLALFARLAAAARAAVAPH